MIFFKLILSILCLIKSQSVHFTIFALKQLNFFQFVYRANPSDLGKIKN